MSEPDFLSRIFLITPRNVDAESFAPKLEEALDAGDVASLLIDIEIADEGKWVNDATKLAEIAQARGVATLVMNESRIAARAKADGVHVDRGVEDIKDAADRLIPNGMIVGGGQLLNRHDAMQAGEADVDYVFFGRLDREQPEGIHKKSQELGQWWAEYFAPPCVVLAGTKLESIEGLARNGIEFAGLREAVWDHADGPKAAIVEANKILEAASAEWMAANADNS